MTLNRLVTSVSRHLAGALVLLAALGAVLLATFRGSQQTDDSIVGSNISFEVFSGPGKSTRLSIPPSYLTFPKNRSGGNQFIIELQADLHSLEPWAMAEVFHEQSSRQHFETPTADWRAQHTKLEVWIQGNRTGVTDLYAFNPTISYIYLPTDIEGWTKFREGENDHMERYVPVDPESTPVARIFCGPLRERLTGFEYCSVKELYSGFWIDYKFPKTMLADFMKIGDQAKALVGRFMVKE